MQPTSSPSRKGSRHLAFENGLGGVAGSADGSGDGGSSYSMTEQRSNRLFHFSSRGECGLRERQFETVRLAWSRTDATSSAISLPL
jgi:hypothetical protein